ncbi:uncharacterized protein PV09_05311 [Verruconis gallopava]|uniref:Homeobox domain-containing protein n=1 Tax=Verruconis gallopava TaxID=253628 RepID=A0A0D2AAG4_9PEZI|nr:uncharacterized protein PV09_05311 [Verruconis gallopava]KIW03550.1 hypothetical protein PV09_05311 [Verruconis gallopava]
MSSPPSSGALEEEASKSKTSSPDRTIAFLVHSPDSVANNLPPDCDNKPLARQRRRRTSPDDQRVLEEAFLRNPRPSKEERQEIISKVALGDKEVQIWFQNRRQSSRRKAKPLNTSDIDSQMSGKSSSPAPSSPIREHVDVDKTREEQPGAQGASPGCDLTQTVGVEASVEHGETSIQNEITRSDKTKVDIATEDKKGCVQHDTQSTAVAASITSSQDLPASTLPTDVGSSQTLPSSSQDALFSSLTRPTYLANRRSASFARQHTDEVPVASSVSTQDQRVPGLRKSGSYLRLSTTEDGQARVIDRSIPSPPRAQPVATSPTNDRPPLGGLRRSYSAAGLSDHFTQSGSEFSSRAKVPRVSQLGRSRDSRAWEFWCDSEARNSLVNKAEQENSGSAADAIGLIRQNSRTALRPNSRKTNSAMVGRTSVAALNSGKPTKVRLQRANTSYGRLQQPESKDSKKGTEEQLSPSGDSDKENWDPEDNQANAASRRRPPAISASNPRRGRTILGENTQLPSYATSFGGFMDAEKRRTAPPAAVDAEVEAFMGAGGGNEDLDCVQSLLSLSKGNWR